MGLKISRQCVAAACALIAGCGVFERNPEPGTTGGQIVVGTPRVSGRERLINDRRAQEEWLQAQLATVDQQRFDANASIDTRSLAAFAAGVAVKADPSVAVSRAQQAANLALVQQQATSAIAAEQVRTAAVDQIKASLAKGEIDAKEAATRIQALGIDYPKLNSAVAATVPSPSASGAGTAASKLSTSLLDALKANQLNPPSPASGALANVVASPIDLFRDKLALREEIRNEINENALDETHDLHRHTLYRLTFDATLVPDNDTSAWAVISASLVEPGISDDIWGQYRQHLEERLQDKFQERVRLLSAALPSCNQSSIHEQLKCAVPKVFTSRVSTQILGMLANYGAVTSRLESRDFNETYRMFSQTNKLRGVPQPVVGAVALSDAERVIFQVLAMTLYQDFTSERLGCYYRLRSNTAGGGTYPPPFSSTTLTDYGISVSYPEFAQEEENPANVVAKRVCRYKNSLPRSGAAVAKEFAGAISAIVQPKVYAVTPKEAVQRISDVSSRRAASEFVAGLSALAGVGAIDAMIQSVRVNDSFLQSLRRQPLVVGFATAPTDKDPNSDKEDEKKGTPAKFGWVLGPTFSIVNDGKKPAFRHTVRQQAVTAAISVPSWWDKVTIDMTAKWRRENGGQPEFAADVFSAKYSVPLPRKLAALDGIFVDSGSSREPEVDTLYTTSVQVGQPARLLIRGDNIWRATEVLLGSQPANRVRLLPDMRGVIAEFDAVSTVFGANSAGGSADRIDVSVATSDGFVSVGSATVVNQSASTGPRVIAGFGKRFAADQPTSLSVSPPLKSFRTAELWAKSKANAVLHVKLADTTTGMEVARDGASIRVAPFGTNLKLKNGDLADLYLVVVSDATNQPEYVAVATDSVYFEKLTDSSAKVEWASAGAGLRDVKLTFPPAASVAYEALKSGSVVVTSTATLTDGRTIPMEAITCKVDKKPCSFKPKAGAPLKTEDATALKQGEFSLAIKVTGMDAPEVSPAALAGK